MLSSPRVVAVCLGGVAVSLLSVGVISATPLRHVIQVLPIGLALVVRPWPWGTRAAMPIFAIWLLLMSLIWLYLAGVQTFFTGTFSPTEVALTLLIGSFSGLGLWCGIRARLAAGVTSQVAAVVVFAVVQVGAMWVSFLPPFANR